MFTSSFAWTSSPASVASTSFAFMFDEVPEPVWKTSIGNWSSSSPEAIRCGAGGDAIGLVAVEQAEVGVRARGRALDAAEPACDGRRDRLAGDREVGDRLRRLAAPELLGRLTVFATRSSVGTQDDSAARFSAALEQLVPGDELDARAAERLAGGRARGRRSSSSPSYRTTACHPCGDEARPRPRRSRPFAAAGPHGRPRAAARPSRWRPSCSCR